MLVDLILNPGILQGGIGVIEVNETTETRSLAGEFTKPLHGVGHQRMRDDPQIPTWQLPTVVERSIQVRHVHVLQEVFEEPVTQCGILPAIDVGEKQDRLGGATELERHGVEEFIAMDHRNRLHAEVGRKLERHPRLKDTWFDLRQIDQLRPWLVRPKEAIHPLRDVDRHPVGVGDLPAELSEPEVVAHVGVGDEDAIHQRSRIDPVGKRLLKEGHLLLDRRGGLDEMKGTSDMVDDPEGGGEL